MKLKNHSIIFLINISLLIEYIVIPFEITAYVIFVKH